MNINTEETNLLIEEEDIRKINNDLIEQKKNLNKIQKLTISNLVISIVLLIIIIVITIEYNIVLNNFNGFAGMEVFINKTTIIVDDLINIINNVNKTEVEIYLRDVKFLIDDACQSLKCH